MTKFRNLKIWCLLSVGQLTFGAVSPNNNVAEVLGSNLNGKTRIIPVVENKIKYNHIKIPGDIMLGGLFPVHNTEANESLSSQCGDISEYRGVHRVEAMLYAIDRINRDPTILPGIRLGAHILDSCGSASYALNQSLEFVKGLIGEGETAYTCSNKKKPQLRPEFVEQPIASVVGGSYSTVSVQVANLLGLFKIVQVSYASTNEGLSDKKKFGFFARTVPSDKLQAQAMVDIAVHFKWNYVTIIYSNGDYGQMGADAFKDAARQKKVCIAAEEKISKIEQLDEIITNVFDKSVGQDTRTGARVVVLYTRNDHTKALLEIAHEHNKHRLQKEKVIFLASEAWEMQPKTTEGVEKTAEGALVLSLASEQITPFNNYFMSLQPGTRQFERNNWLREMWEFKFRCSFDKQSTKKKCHGIPHGEFHPDNKVQFVIDAVYAIAHALHAKWIDECRADVVARWDLTNPKSEPLCEALKHIDGTEFYQDYLLKVKFKAISGQNDFSFDPLGDGPAYYQISNFQLRNGNYSYVAVGKWMNGDLKMNDSRMFWNAHGKSAPLKSICSASCDIGFVKQTAGAGDDIYCCWTCTKCEAHQKLANISTCEDCPLGWMPDDKRNTCYVLPLQHMQWSSAYAVLPVIFSIMGIIVTLVVVFIYVKYNGTPVVKASGRELSYILLASIIFCYSMTFVLLAKPTTGSCAIRRVGVGFGFALLYAAMLVKTNRIFRIFHYAKQNITPQFISPFSQVVIACMLAGMQLLGSCIWLIMQWPGTRVDYPDRGTAVLKCNVPDALFLVSLAYDSCLIIACTVFAIKARRVPENFNEAKFIGFTMYTTCIIWLAFLPIYFGTGSDYQIQTTTLCISISMSATVTLVLIFSPKLWILIMEPEKNTRKSDKFRAKPSDYSSGGYQNHQSQRLMARDPVVDSPIIPKRVSVDCGNNKTNNVVVRQYDNSNSATSATTITNPGATLTKRSSTSSKKDSVVESNVQPKHSAGSGKVADTILCSAETYRSFQASPSMNSMPGDRSTDQYL